MTKDQINSIVEKLKKKKHDAFRLKGSKGNSPKSLQFRHSRESHTPFIEIELEGKTDLYELEKTYSKDKISSHIAKWILFSIHAKAQNGQFHLIIPKGQEKKFQKIITDKKLDIEIVSV